MRYIYSTTKIIEYINGNNSYLDFNFKETKLFVFYYFYLIIRKIIIKNNIFICLW